MPNSVIKFYAKLGKIIKLTLCKILWNHEKTLNLPSDMMLTSADGIRNILIISLETLVFIEVVMIVSSMPLEKSS